VVLCFTLQCINISEWRICDSSPSELSVWTCHYSLRRTGRNQWSSNLRVDARSDFTDVSQSISIYQTIYTQSATTSDAIKNQQQQRLIINAAHNNYHIIKMTTVCIFQRRENRNKNNNSRNVYALHSGKGALSDAMSVCLSVCRQSPICESCTKTTKPINVNI